MSYFSEWSIDSIPNYIEASTKDELRLLLIKKNIKDGMSYKYSTPQFIEGKWIIWFEEDIKLSGLLKDELATKVLKVKESK